MIMTDPVVNPDRFFATYTVKVISRSGHLSWINEIRKINKGLVFFGNPIFN